MQKDEYLLNKRNQVLEVIGPMCKSFGIDEYDYVIEDDGYGETLKLYDTRINCSCNSIDAIVNELVRYLVVARDIYLGTFDAQVKHRIKEHWRD